MRIAYGWSCYNKRMAKVSMLIPDDALAEIDASAGGNRSAFMIAASLQRARDLRRLREDREIADLCAEHAEADEAVTRDWESTLSDGLA
jgi:hypothetical protein